MNCMMSPGKTVKTVKTAGTRGDECPGFFVFVPSGHGLAGKPVTSARFARNGRTDVQTTHVVLCGDDEQAVVGVGADAAF